MEKFSNKKAYSGDIFTGDIETAFDDTSYDEGGLEVVEGDFSPTPLTQGDLDLIAEGAPASKVVAKKKVLGTAGAQGRAAIVKMQNLQKPLSVPGAAISASLIPTMIVDNARIIRWGQDKQVAGALVLNNINQHNVEFVEGSVSSAAAGAGPNQAATMTFDDSELPTDFEYGTAPMIFVTAAASALNATPGARFKLKIQGWSIAGAPIAEDEWVLERINAQLPMKITIIPVCRYRDRVVPVRVKFGNTVGGVVRSLRVVITDAATTENLQVVLPGIDSEELTQFLKQWNIPR